MASSFSFIASRRPFRWSAAVVVGSLLLLLLLAAFAHSADDMTVGNEDEETPTETFPIEVFHENKKRKVYSDDFGRDYPIDKKTGNVLIRGNTLVNRFGQRVDAQGNELSETSDFFTPTDEGLWVGREEATIPPQDNPCNLTPLDAKKDDDPEGWIDRTINTLATAIRSAPKKKWKVFFWRKSAEENPMPACNVDSFGKNVELAMEFRGSYGLQMNQLIKNTIMATVKYNLAKKTRRGRWGNKMKCFIKFVPGFRSWARCDKSSYGWAIASKYSMCDSDKWKICAAARGLQRPAPKEREPPLNDDEDEQPLVTV